MCEGALHLCVPLQMKMPRCNEAETLLRALQGGDLILFLSCPPATLPHVSQFLSSSLTPFNLNSS